MKIVTISLIVILTVGLLAAPLPAEAQQAGKVYRIGFLTPGTAELKKPWMAGFRQGLEELGYIEGKNVVLEERYMPGLGENLPELAAELVRLKVDIMVVQGVFGFRAAHEASKTIPIVFMGHPDPVGDGIVDSLARPGGNATGLSTVATELAPNQLELLKEVVPSASRVALLWTPGSPEVVAGLKNLQAVSPALGVTLLPVEFTKPEDLDRVFAAILKERPDALYVFGAPLIGIYRRQIAEFALKNRLPTMGTVDILVEGGILMSYGVSFTDLYHRAATYVGKILKGAKPGDLPVEQAMKFDLIINLKTAKQLGITIPPEVLFQATRVIRSASVSP